MILPPLALYIHFPWCIRKCPYCDFNSHALPGEWSASAYMDALLADFAHQYPLAGRRPIESLFIGGGTPSLLPGQEVARLLQGIGEVAPFAQSIEITLEANPGAAEAGRFAGYRRAGVNRLSIGVQSFNDNHLQTLGRIHDGSSALAAFQSAREAGFDNINLDLMFGLPGQTPAEALADLRMALGLGSEHLSWYQLTLEPNTAFSRHPPPLPDEDAIDAMQAEGMACLTEAGLERYEVSAFARPGRECRHNLNYWHFGDYLGIGAGAHGKLTEGDGRWWRFWKERHPDRYLDSPVSMAGQRVLEPEDRVVEFMMNALRLRHGFDSQLFPLRTGLPLSQIEQPLAEATAKGLLEERDGVIRPTELGFRFLNDLIGVFDRA